MRKLFYILLLLGLFTGCGSQETGQPENLREPEYTEEEQFLQEAYWYLQTDEQQIFSWENGILEDVCAEESTTVIGPEGETDICGMELKRVRYTYFELGNIQQNLDLYFTPDGAFVGTNERMYWHGDILMWMFVDRREIAPGESFTVTTVLKNQSETTRSFSAYGAIAWQEFFKNGLATGGGVDASGRSLKIGAGEVLVFQDEITAEQLALNLPEGESIYGEYTIVDMMMLSEYADEDAYNLGEDRGAQMSFNEFKKVNVTEQ